MSKRSPGITPPALLYPPQHPTAVLRVPGICLLTGDCRHVLRQLPSESVHVVVTSPPYWGLRDYGIPATIWGGREDCLHVWGDSIPSIYGSQNYGEEQGVFNRQAEGAQYARHLERGCFCQACGAWRGVLGLEPTPELHVANLVAVFSEVRRVLRRDGTLWLNYGDCYAQQGRRITPEEQEENAARAVERAYGTAYANQRGWDRSAGTVQQGVAAVGRRTDSRARGNLEGGTEEGGLKPKDLCGMPWRVALGLQRAGWWLRSDCIWCLSERTNIYASYRDELHGDQIHVTTMRDMIRSKQPEDVKLWNGRQWTQVKNWWKSKQDGGLRIVLRGGEVVECSPRHLWPTQGGLRAAGDLEVGDCLTGCRLPEATYTPQCIPDPVGWFVGLYIANGSYSGTKIQLSCNTSNVDELYRRLSELALAYSGTCEAYRIGGEGATVNLTGRLLDGILETYVKGEGAHGKHLRRACWNRTNVFLQAVLEGYLIDGHFDSKNRRWRLGFCNNEWLARDLRTLCARLGYHMTLKPGIAKCQTGLFPMFKGEIRMQRSGHHNEKNPLEIVSVEVSTSRSFVDVEVADDPHTFALASGLLTHNSKKNPTPCSVKDRPTMSHEYVFLFARSTSYFYDSQAVRVAHETQEKRKTRIQYRGKSVATSTFMPPHPGGRNLWSVWPLSCDPYRGAHFAVMPRKLIRQCLQASVSEHGCCTICGAQWERVMVETAVGLERLGESYHDHLDDLGRGQRAVPCAYRDGEQAYVQRGWRPQCECSGAWSVERRPVLDQHGIQKVSKKTGELRWKNVRTWEGDDQMERGPAVVLDPFSGSGRVALVAHQRGALAIGIDLNENYQQLAWTQIQEEMAKAQERNGKRKERKNVEQAEQGVFF